MLTPRYAKDRGAANFGWLDSRHTFSFGNYHDPEHMGFGPLRVINEDRVAPAQGFGTHSHRDMEIISWVLEGALEHKDSLGTGAVIRPGEVQRMSAGSGVMHSEFNHASDRTTHFLQIWIEPNVRGIEPSYEQRRFEAAEKRGRLRLVASPDGRDGSVTIHADASIWSGLFDGAERAVRPLDPARRTYVQVVRGKVEVNGRRLDTGDAAAIEHETELTIANGDDAEVLVFDLQ